MTQHWDDPAPEEIATTENAAGEGGTPPVGKPRRQPLDVDLSDGVSAIYNRDEACAWAVWRDQRMVGLIGPPGTRGKYSFQALLRACARYPAHLGRKLRSPIPPRVGDPTDVVLLHADDRLRARRRAGLRGPLAEVVPAEWGRGWPAGELIIDAVKLRALLPGQAEASREPAGATDGDPPVATSPENLAAAETAEGYVAWYLHAMQAQGRTPSKTGAWDFAKAKGFKGTRKQIRDAYPDDRKATTGRPRRAA